MNKGQIVLSKGWKTGRPITERDAITIANSGFKNLKVQRTLGLVHRTVDVILVPNTFAGRQAKKAADSINEATSGFPLDDKHSWYLEFIRSAWSQRTVVWGWQLFKAIPEPFGKGQPFEKMKNPLKEMYRDLVEQDSAIWECMWYGAPLIRRFAEDKGQSYPFVSPLDLFIHTCKETITQELFRPIDGDPDPPTFIQYKCQGQGFSKRRNAQIAAYKRFLRGDDEYAKDWEKRLASDGWSGTCILALRAAQRERSVRGHWKRYIQPHWKRYISSLSHLRGGRFPRWINGEFYRFDGNKKKPFKISIQGGQAV